MEPNRIFEINIQINKYFEINTVGNIQIQTLVCSKNYSNFWYRDLDYYTHFTGEKTED